MNVFDELVNIYNEIDSNYSKKVADAILNNKKNIETNFSNKRLLNDQAYFLFMFTRLEDRVREISNTLINIIDDKLTKSLSPKEKYAWEILHKNKDIHFINRVALILKKGESDFTLINKYYEQRNKIAHGKTFTIAINMQTVTKDMKRLYNIFK